MVNGSVIEQIILVVLTCQSCVSSVEGGPCIYTCFGPDGIQMNVLMDATYSFGFELQSFAAQKGP